MVTPQRAAPGFPKKVGRTVFGSDIAGYHDVRPGYPDELFAMIGERVPPGGLFGEIGPGTGIATAELLDLKPRQFVAFEPDNAFVEFLRDRFPQIQVIDEDFCSAIANEQFDLIASASSFHWLDASKALRKARKLLRPGGCLAIWWNVYRETGIGDPFAEAVTPYLLELDLPPSQTVSHHYGLDRGLHFERLEKAGFTDLVHHVFRRERVLTAADARALYASFSLVRILPQGRREALLDAIESIVLDQFGGAAPSVLLTPLYLARNPSS